MTPRPLPARRFVALRKRPGRSAETWLLLMFLLLGIVVLAYGLPA